MNPRSFDTEPSPLGGSPECELARASLNQWLDHEISLEPEAILRHRAACASCRAEETTAHLMVQTLQNSPAVMPSAGLADRILAGMQVDRVRLVRPRVRRWTAGFAVAACVALVGLGILRWTSPPESGKMAAVTPKQEMEEASIALGESLNQAEVAVAELKRKTTDEGMKITLPSFTLPTIDTSTGPLERLEPAVASINDVKQGVILSVSPMTNSAKRAANMFLRELGQDLDRKPTMN
ncbi:MAG: hypothetical protein K8T89_18820 [Planctomycetes bacterium]|nr:hypothetical protein [Planctomycetota bacterium]